MPYDKEENKKKVYKICIDTLEKEDVTTIEDLVTFLPIGRDTFYTYFPTDSEEFDIIKRAINKRKVKTKQLLRKVWKSPHAAPAHEITLNLIKDEEEQDEE